MQRSIVVAVKPPLRWDPAVYKAVHESLPYWVPGFCKAAFGDRSLELSYESPSDADEASQITEVTLEVERLIERVAKSFRDVSDRKLAGSEGAPQLAAEDPFPVLGARGDVTSTGRGKLVYAKDFLRLFEAFDAKLSAYCESLGAARELYPSTIETRTLLDSGYLQLSPQLAYFVAPAHLDHESLVAVGDAAIVDPHARAKATSHLGLPTQVLAPTVCYHCFEARRSRAITTGTITSLNKCHRHEVVDVASLERLTTYWMRELIVFGTPEQTRATLDAALTWTTELLTEWGIWFEVSTASDPFFADMGAGNRLFQAAFELKRELKLPLHSGKHIAVASFNNHQKTLVDKLSITASDLEGGQPLTSGCVGWGYERFLYGLMSQLGATLSAWPVHVKQSLGL